MGYVSDAQLSQMRYQREETFRDECVHHPASEVTDASSGFTNTWAADETISCSVTTPEGRAAAGLPLLSVIAEDGGVVVALPHGTTVTPADRLVVNGETYEVVHIGDPGTFGIQVTAYCVRR